MKIKFLQYLCAIGGVAIVLFTLPSYSNTAAGTMANNAQVGCSCHGAASANTTINVTGLPLPSDGYTPGQSYPVTVTVSNATKVAAGINLEVTVGTISSLGAGLTSVSSSKVRHTAPKAMSSGVATFTFNWVAPTSGSGALYLYASANAVNLSGNSAGDAWASYNINIPLSLDFLTFNASAKPNQVKLFWTTNSEDKIKSYVVQKSIDGVQFDSIGTQVATGGVGINTNYAYYDFPPYSGTYYYRLKVMGENNSASISKTQKVEFDNGAVMQGLVWPNPCNSSSDININVFNNKGRFITVKAFDMSGKMVYNFQYKAIKGTNYLTLSPRWENGIYNLKVLSDAGTELSFKQWIQ